MSRTEWAKPVAGIPTPALAMSCVAHSLSRALAMAADPLTEYVPISSNWRTTAVP